MWKRRLRQPGVLAGLAVGLLLGSALLGPPALTVADPADAVTRRTADVAMACWAVAGFLMLTDRRAWARVVWIAGCAAFLFHVAVAFDRVHGWSHAAAVGHVAVTSGFGPGIFVSYAFSLVWLADAAWWWAGPASYDRRPAGLDRAVHGFLAFIVFNGTVVYESGFIRYAGIVAFVILGGLWVRPVGRESGSRRPPS